MMDKKLKVTIIVSSAALCTATLALGTLFAVPKIKNASLQGQGGYDTMIIPQQPYAQTEADGPDLSELEASSELPKDLSDQISENEVALDETALFDEELSYFSYRIKKGDMIGVIAETYGVTQDTLLSVNSIKSSRTIQIGQYLKIPSMSGILYTVKSDDETPASVAEKYEVDSYKCAFVNNLQTESSLKAGETIFVPDAKLDWVTRQEINGDLFKKPIRSSFRYSSYYGWRQNPITPSKRTFHQGIDMACPQGTNIYAALEGTVTTAGWSDIYGNYVIITHHSGYKTLYGHMSRIIAKKGQYVTQNTIIGKVGSTGQSTGPHVHFQVYKNGKTVNPMNLW